MLQIPRLILSVVYTFIKVHVSQKKTVKANNHNANVMSPTRKNELVSYHKVRMKPQGA